MLADDVIDPTILLGKGDAKVSLRNIAKVNEVLSA